MRDQVQFGPVENGPITPATNRTWITSKTVDETFGPAVSASPFLTILIGMKHSSTK